MTFSFGGGHRQTAAPGTNLLGQGFVTTLPRQNLQLREGGPPTDQPNIPASPKDAAPGRKSGPAIAQLGACYERTPSLLCSNSAPVMRAARPWKTPGNCRFLTFAPFSRTVCSITRQCHAVSILSPGPIRPTLRQNRPRNWT